MKLQEKNSAMEVIRASHVPSSKHHFLASIQKQNFHLQFNRIPTSNFSSFHGKFLKKIVFTAKASNFLAGEINPVEENGDESEDQEEKFDWFSQWYPIMPICDLDKRVPCGKKVMGLDVVVWWDKNENEWKVFDDICPHRLAPLSEGRIDQSGRLQCVYHGWCFGGSGDCKFIPQAPRDGPPVNTFKKACATVYPSTLQNNIVWFWPNSDPQFKDILLEKKPPYIPEMDDPSYITSMGNRDIPYGHEILIENLMDPAHLPYAHYGILPGVKPKNSVKSDSDREGGLPLNLSVHKLDITGFTARQDEGSSKFIPPCVFVVSDTDTDTDESNGKDQLEPTPQKRSLLVFFSAPVGPGKCRLIWAFPRNFAHWVDQIFPRWLFHLVQNLVLDSDLRLLHLQEHKIMEIGPLNWQKACYVPTKADTLVIHFRRWLNRYSGGHIDWGNKFSLTLPPTPPREQLMDRYWTHTVNCESCNAAYKGFNVVEIVMKVMTVVLIGIVAITKQSLMSMAARTKLVSVAVICFAASKWLSSFKDKNFRFHDYYHGLK